MNVLGENNANEPPSPGASPPAEDVVLRRLESGDIAALIGLESQCFSTVWREDQFFLALRQKVFFAFGLFLENARLVGYISVYHLAGELEILNIAVSREQRRRGFGLRLLTEALRQGRERGLERAVLEVRTSNAAAIALYERLGFSLAGKRPGYYEDTGEDALIYVAPLQ